jgi:HK97 family phage prohead protease
MSKKLERRFLNVAELRSVDGDKPVIAGYAAMFNCKSEDLGGYREVIKPGAFTDCLAGSPDIRCLRNHEPDMILGRTPKTLKVREDNKGLYFECELPDTSYARDLMESIKRGDISQCSFGFYATEADFSIQPTDEDPDEFEHIRELASCEVFDVSPVTYPAYPQTSVDMRALFPEGEPDSVKEWREKKTKRVDGVDLTADCFAYVGDKDKTETWKLPIKFPGDEEKTKTHIQNALARFSSTEGIPESERPAVLAKIKAAAKAHGIHVADEESNSLDAAERERMRMRLRLAMSL